MTRPQCASSEDGGGVAAGSFIALCQSAGALGVSCATSADGITSGNNQRGTAKKKNKCCKLHSPSFCLGST